MVTGSFEKIESEHARLGASNRFWLFFHAVTTAAVFEKLLEPHGGFECSLCDCLAHQGGVIDMARSASARLLPLELEEALESGRPVLLDYVDGFGNRTERIVQPLHVRRRGGQLMLIAYCQLRNDRRTFKLDRVVRMMQMDMLPLVIPVRSKSRGGAKIYDAPEVGAGVYEASEQIELASLDHLVDMPTRVPQVQSELSFDLTTEPNPS